MKMTLYKIVFVSLFLEELALLNGQSPGFLGVWNSSS